MLEDKQELNTQAKSDKSKTRSGSLAEAIAGAIFTTIFFILFNVYYDEISFLNEDFDRVLNLYNASLIVGIILHISRIFIRSYSYQVLTEAVSITFFIVIAYQLWVIFPFDTSVIGDQRTWDNIFRFLIIVPPALTVLATMVKVIKLASSSESD